MQGKIGDIIMGLVSACTKVVRSAFKSSPKVKVLVDGKLVSMGKAKKLVDFSGEKFEFHVKPDITMPISPKTLKGSKPAIKIKKNAQGKLDENVQGELGNVSVRLAKRFKNLFDSAKSELSNVFKGQDISVRSKGANSIYSKLERSVLKGKSIRTDSVANSMITDGIGGRILMKDLTQSDIAATLKEIKIDGKTLSDAEQKIMTKFFKNEKLTSAELEIANKYSRTVKIALAEKQSAPIFNQVMLSSMKEALDSGATTIEKLEKSGVSKDLIKELKLNKDKITPLRITTLENYTGKNGIPYFSDKQIAQLKELQLATGNSFDIISCPEAKRFGDALTSLEKQALKDSGYTTAQFNATLSDGTVAEIQIRGKGPFGEVEHIAYDSTQAKNTLSKVYDEYKAAIKSLTPEQSKLYETYRSQCYDYYRDLELGIKSQKPTLPSGLDKILSEENMIKLHNLDTAIQNEAKKGFEEHIRLVA